jgi:hydrogenase expression/formation protein HypC
MCLAIPGKIISIENEYAQIDYSGVTKSASLRLCSNAKVGDYVLVHAGFVIQILGENDGHELDELIDDVMGLTKKQ